MSPDAEGRIAPLGRFSSDDAPQHALRGTRGGLLRVTGQIVSPVPENALA